MIPKTLKQLRPNDLDRFMSKIDIKPDKNSCWEWKGSLNSGGYGDFTVYEDGKSCSFRAHRVSLFLETGEQDLVARHKCDNRACCNPYHLEWGDHQDNSDDKMSRGRGGHVWGTAHGMCKLKPSQVRAIRTAFDDRLGAKFIAKKFKISERHAYKIAAGEYWKKLEN